MKKIAICVYALIVLAVLCACSSKPPTENQILSDISPEISYLFVDDPAGGQYQALTVESLEIEKRQTDTRNDTVWCVADLKNEYYKARMYIECYYEYYDTGGWMLEGWWSYQDTVLSVLSNPFSEDDLIDFVYADYTDSFETRNGYTFDIDINEIDFNSSEQATVSYAQKRTNSNQTYIVYTDCIYSLYFDGAGWARSKETLTERQEWDIKGEWDFAPGKEDDYEQFSLAIDSFDPQTMTATGVCEYYYSHPLSTKEYHNITQLPDADIHFFNGDLRIDCDTYPAVTVTFYTDGEAVATLPSGLGSEKIYRQN